MSGVRKNFSYLFGILTVAMYFIGLVIINRGLGFRNAMIIVSALIAYYIANVYNVATSKYKLKDMTTVIVINGILMTVTTFSKIFTFYEGIILFGIITIFQIAFRYIVIMGVVEKERVVFVGENDLSWESCYEDYEHALNDGNRDTLLLILYIRFLSRHAKRSSENGFSDDLCFNQT